jgi:hypothetical protein
MAPMLRDPNTTTVHVILSDRRERRIPFLERNLPSQNEILRRFTPQNDMYGCSIRVSQTRLPFVAGDAHVSPANCARFLNGDEGAGIDFVGQGTYGLHLFAPYGCHY